MFDLPYSPFSLKGLGLPREVRLPRLIGNGFDLSADPVVFLRVSELLGIALNLILTERGEAVPVTGADEARTKDDIDHPAVFAVDGSAGAHPVDLAFLIAYDAYLFLKGVVCLDESSDRLLQLLLLHRSKALKKALLRL